MNTLPANLYSADQVRELDRLAIEEYGMSANILMERAGEAAFNVMHRIWPDATKIRVLCGTGNNGGDGFVIARLAREQHLDIKVYQIGDSNKLQGDALAAMQRLLGADVSPEVYAGQDLSDADVIVDALLGTGVSGEVTEEYRVAIEAVNASGKPVLAVDVPSGLDANNGAVSGTAVRADQTVTFIGMKQGLLFGRANDYCGEIHFDSLNVPRDLYTMLDSSVSLIDYAQLKGLLPPRKADAHKGDFGHVLILGGGEGMSGAVHMAGEAALRAGAGIVSVATHPAHAAVLNNGRPELMCHGIEQKSQLLPLLEKANVVLVGPGLGQDMWAKVLLKAALTTALPLVVDADALNLLAKVKAEDKSEENEAGKQKRDNWILTPHPGEAARLLGDNTDIQADRFAAANALQARYSGIVVLKGAGTLVAEADKVSLCHAGNPGMATAGMGDVLAGIIAALLAQKLAPSAAACLGVCLHAAAGDGAAQPAGERGMLASDIMPWIRRLANP